MLPTNNYRHYVFLTPVQIDACMNIGSTGKYIMEYIYLKYMHAYAYGDNIAMSFSSFLRINIDATYILYVVFPFQPIYRSNYLNIY